MSNQDEADRLFDLLNSDEVPRAVMMSGFSDFSNEAKNEVAARVAREFANDPRGRLLGRLLMIQTEENKADLAKAFIANLRSSRPQARQASLYGLAKLDHESLVHFALLSLRDDTDQVLATACDILLPKAKDDPGLRQILKDVYLSHKDNPDFHMTTSRLEAGGISD